MKILHLLVDQNEKRLVVRPAILRFYEGDSSLFVYASGVHGLHGLILEPVVLGLITW